MVAGENLHIGGGAGCVAHVRAYVGEKVAVGAFDEHGVVAGAAAHCVVAAGVHDAGSLTGVDHCLDVLLVGLPVGKENAGRTWHGEQEGVGGQRILLDGVGRVAAGRTAVLHVVVLDEGHGVALVAAAVVVVVDKILAGTQLGPVAAVDGIAHGVAELEVEGGRRLLGAVNPRFDGGVAAPVLTHRERHAAGVVVVPDMGTPEALHHVVAEACVTQVVEQEVLVGLDDGLHVAALVVEVAAATPVLALVVVAEGVAVGVGPSLRLTAIVVAGDVSRGHLIGDVVVGLGRVVHP